MAWRVWASAGDIMANISLCLIRQQGFELYGVFAGITKMVALPANVLKIHHVATINQQLSIICKPSVRAAMRMHYMLSCLHKTTAS